MDQQSCLDDSRGIALLGRWSHDIVIDYSFLLFAPQPYDRRPSVLDSEPDHHGSVVAAGVPAAQALGHYAPAREVPALLGVIYVALVAAMLPFGTQCTFITFALFHHKTPAPDARFRGGLLRIGTAIAILITLITTKPA